MRIKNITYLFFVFLFFSPFSFAGKYDSLNEYSTPESVVNIFDNKLIVQDIKNLTKSKYNEFIGNYEAFADPKKLRDGGLLVDGWLRELRLENSSAMVIEPDGKLYLAWVVPDNNKINYMTNDKTMTEIQPDIKQWANRFDNHSFDGETKSDEFVDVIPKNSYFETNSYKIKVMLTCAERQTICNKAVYQSVKKSDGEQMAIMGQVIRKDCHSSVCPAASYQFENRNKKTKYILTTDDPALNITINNQTVLSEKGRWVSH